jgi:hypothetical protein
MAEQAAPTDTKVIILFKQTGDAPILKQNKVKVAGLWVTRPV